MRVISGFHVCGVMVASLVTGMILSGCGGSTDGYYDSDTAVSTGGYGDIIESSDIGLAAYEDTVAYDTSAADYGSEQTPQPGQLTAAEWDDNLNFDRFLEYINDIAQDWPGMAFLPVADRVEITVVGSDGVAMSGVRVKVSDQDGSILDVLTRPDGRTQLFPAREGIDSTDGLTVAVSGFGDNGSYEGPLTIEDRQVLIQVDSPGVVPTGMDIAFVVDATGSMGDELEFIKSEIADIVSDIGTADQQYSLRFGLVVYRDFGDEYVTRAFDFTESLSQFQQNLGNQWSDGGGDYEEAVHKAYQAMNELSWRDGNVARVAFHVADAPPHTPDSAAMLEQVETARKASIGIYPVAASGVADSAQYLMRMAAQSTLARYVFITDDSGIGGGHEGGEPTIAKDCMQVQYLNKLIKRLLRSELAGGYIPPTANEVIKEVGSPTDGVCTFQDGTKAWLW